MNFGYYNNQNQVKFNVKLMQRCQFPIFLMRLKCNIGNFQRCIIVMVTS